MVSTLTGSSSKRVQKIGSRGAAGRTSTINHLRAGWIPVNQKVVTDIRRLLESGRNDPEQLGALLTSDLSLYLHITAELSKNGPLRATDPISRIAELPAADILKVLPRKASDISRHNLKKISPTQAGQIQRTLVARTTAEAIAEKTGLSSEDAIVGSLFADLGRQLVAWNYPLIFNRALTLQRNGLGDLDIEIEKILGIDPRRVSSQLAQQYGMPQELQLTLSRLSDKEQRAGDPGGSDLQSVLTHSRLFSEHLDPKNFSRGEALFEKSEAKMQSRFPNFPSRQEIESRLGPALQPYEQVIPPRSRLAVAGWQDRLTVENAHTLMVDTVHLRIAPAITDLVNEVVRQIDSAKSGVDALTALVGQVIPRAGFSGGCVYLLSSDQRRLIPEVRIGGGDLLGGGTVALHSDHDLAKALFSPTPYKEVADGSEENKTVRYSAGFESKRSNGVLVLCSRAASSEEEEQEQLNSFRIIHALFQRTLRKFQEI